MKFFYIFCIFIFVIESVSAQTFKLDSADVKTQDGIVKALYEVISGPAGQARNWERFRALFDKNAKLIPVVKNQQAQIQTLWLSVEDYISRFGQNLEKNGFFEQEIGRKTDQFAHIAHLFSTYQSKRTAEGEVFMRGINSIQLMYDGKRWWIVNIMWLGESPENPIPTEYLPLKKN
jgi:hypothetical protein